MTKNKEETKEIVYTPGSKLENRVFEQIQDEEGNPMYVFAPSEAVWRNKKEMHMTKGAEMVGKLCKAPLGTGDHLETDATEYWPLKKCPWPLCKQDGDLHFWKNLTDDLDEHKLWNDTYQFIYDHLDLPEEELYDVLTAWTFSTWIPEQWRVVPYLFFYGPVASGKTRALEVLQNVCYRGILGSNVSSAALYRGVEAWHPTVFLDEAEIYSKEHRAEVIGLLNSGYRKGQFAWRVKNTELGMELELFDVFGFKALAGTESLRNTLESRSIIVNMMKNIRPVNFLVDEKKALEIRNKLLVWRLLKLSDGSDGNDRFPEVIPSPLKFADGRIIELFFCLYQVANKGRENILEYAKYTHKKRLDVEQTSQEADVLQCIVEYGSFVENQFIPTSQIAELFNKDRPDREKWKTSSIGRLIGRLGLNKKRGSGGVNGWEWNEKRIGYLKKRYNIEGDTPKKPSLPSLPSLTKPVATVDQVREIVSPLYSYKGLCGICGVAATLTKTVTTFGDRNTDVCEECGVKVMEELKKRDSNA